MRFVIPALLGLSLTATVALAGSHAAKVDPAVKARQSHMQLYAFNLGPLGAMAKGEMEYDAEAASLAATRLHTLAAMDQSGYWKDGTANDASENTAAKPAIWEDMADFDAKMKAMTEAAAKMETAAGESLDALKAAIGGVGGACGACHKPYRQSDS